MGYPPYSDNTTVNHTHVYIIHFIYWVMRILGCKMLSQFGSCKTLMCYTMCFVRMLCLVIFLDCFEMGNTSYNLVRYIFLCLADIFVLRSSEFPESFLMSHSCWPAARHLIHTFQSSSQARTCFEKLFCNCSCCFR